MLNTPDYLAISKRRAECASCGRSLVESDRHPSVLVEPGAVPGEAPASPEQPTIEGAAETGVASPSPEAAPQPEGEATAASDDGAPSAPASAAADAAAFQRLDYCDECWQKVKDQAYFSFWIGRRNPTDIPVVKLNRHERNLALVALFDSLSERAEGDTDYTPHLFFLAHLLMRYRIFKYLPSETDAATGAATLRFSRTDGEEQARVADVDLSSEEIVRVKEEVEAYLQQSTGQRIVL